MGALDRDKNNTSPAAKARRAAPTLPWKMSKFLLNTPCFSKTSISCVVDFAQQRNLRILTALVLCVLSSVLGGCTPNSIDSFEGSAGSLKLTSTKLAAYKLYIEKKTFKRFGAALSPFNCRLGIYGGESSKPGKYRKKRQHSDVRKSAHTSKSTPLEHSRQAERYSLFSF